MKSSRPVSNTLVAPPQALPGLRPWFYRVLRVLSGPYLRLGLGVARVRVTHPERIVSAFGGFYAGDHRLILAFRHPYGDEPQVLGWYCMTGIRRDARKLGIPLPPRTHGIFVHGAEVPRWGGPLIRFLLPRIGALPVHHTRIHPSSMRAIREAITTGDHPLALSPEGQVSYSAHTLPRIEGGTIRLGLEAAKQVNPTPVLVLPISFHRRYDSHRSQKEAKKILNELSGFLGLALEGISTTPLDPRSLLAIAYGLLEQWENYYDLDRSDPTLSPDQRLGRVVTRAIERGERILGLSSAHALDPVTRVYRVRQKGWERIYTDSPTRAGLGRILANRKTGEAWYAMRHMELADFGWYFRVLPPWLEEWKSGDQGPGPGSVPRDEIVCDYIQNLWDWANRLAGGTIAGRRNIRPYTTIMRIGQPINLRPTTNVAEGLGALEQQFLNLIQEDSDDY